MRPATNGQGIDYLREARDLAPELAAAADEIERRRELPEPVVAALVERGFYRLGPSGWRVAPLATSSQPRHFAVSSAPDVGS